MASVCSFAAVSNARAELLGASDVEKLRLHTERPRRSLRHAPLNRENRIAQVEEPRDSGELRKKLLEQLDAFGIDLDVVVAEPRDVSAWAPEAGDEAGPDRITAGGHDHRNGLCHVPRRQRGRRSPRQDQIHLQTDQLARESGEPFVAAVRRSVRDVDVLTVAVPELTQSLSERIEVGRVERGASRLEHADPIDLAGRL